MKKQCLSLLVAAAFALAACGDNTTKTEATPAKPAATQTAETTNNNPNLKTYVVGSELGYLPFEFMNDKGQADGFEIELLTEIAKMGGFNVQFVNSPRSAVTSTLNDGSRQIWASAIAVSPARLAEVDMSEPFMDFESAVAVADRPENSNVNALNDLAGKKIAFNKASVSNTELVAALRATAVPENSFFLALKSLRSGRADAIVGDTRVFQYYKNHQNDKVRIISLGKGPQPLAFAVKKGNTELLNKINSGIAKMKADGSLDKLIAKWFGGE
ncbi:transporter substrate-binding domain-containing protein [Kingella negevensis]|uniref:Putative amino-acid ABC transporter-binding protein n=1 Tax=Kingella negevensis TaxID=1522312 RepID=A0A238HDA7_9NEIS|nr:transporter substrate-binding domain-containing protein [Kingella negevensis]MDK4679296.1 transporter substrate-binding domain-containing protein [Kingella negevensis]MDK4682982.1 transporter substrate-binding domain-containing protein [Kingella negevensis]MDK4683824.1 transporter substrate-binding domain-containing protein [Kingella negevensis]MDK4691182.1 transporter substrate-binding domain-containing protein [Kingella negevensis]MDK4693670.1 transporter substrate-binding domain-containi